MDNLNIKTIHVCRTCLTEIINPSFFYLDFTQIDGEPTLGQKLSSCIPELDLRIVPNTVTCGKCADTINSLYIFKEECLQLERKIGEYIQQKQHTDSGIDLAAVMQFHQLRSKNLAAELKTEAFVKTENYRNEESPTSSCENYAFNETERYTEDVNRKYLTSLQMVERECVIFNTFENFINSDKSEAEENSLARDGSNIVQDLQAVENPDSCNQNLNNEKTGEKPFKRSECEDTCTQIHQLKSRMVTHMDGKSFKCSVCDYSCTRKPQLKNHMLIHTWKKPVKCSICEHSCKIQQLKSHMLTHMDRQPFKCSVCEYSCTQKAQLKNHMLIHTWKKPVKCSLCEHTCKIQQLKSHMLIHMGEKPFKCSVCEYSCTQKQQLKSHMIIHRVEKTTLIPFVNVLLLQEFS